MNDISHLRVKHKCQDRPFEEHGTDFADQSDAFRTVLEPHLVTAARKSRQKKLLFLVRSIQLTFVYQNMNLPTPTFWEVWNQVIWVLTFMGPCIANVFQYTSYRTQLYTVYLYLETALHYSGVTSTHHQERIQLYLQHLVFTIPLLLPAATRCCRYSCMRSWWWVEVTTETCRAVSRYK